MKPASLTYLAHDNKSKRQPNLDYRAPGQAKTSPQTFYLYNRREITVTFNTRLNVLETRIGHLTPETRPIVSSFLSGVLEGITEILK